jgi:SpoVK/Ycf46/Vps4 family AAA+-type ATPase
MTLGVDMARSDLLIALVKAGKQSPDPRFRSTVEAIIAEERSKQHTILADQLSAALVNGVTPPQPAASATVVGELLYELAPERGVDDLVLPRLVREEVHRLLEEHQRAELLRSYGMVPRHRLLLVGPPGNGKTSLACGLAHDLMVPLLVVRYEGLIGSYLGETASRLRKVFDYARQRACVLFLDEFDTVGKERGDVHETGEIKRVVSTLLLQMDQLPAHVVIVSATNHAELLDRAVWRRFQIRLRLPPPKPSEAAEFLRRLFEGFQLASGFQSSTLARQLSGATYSEIEDLFRDIARRAVLESPEPDFPKIVRERLAAWKQRVTTAPSPRRRGEGASKKWITEIVASKVTVDAQDRKPTVERDDAPERSEDDIPF